jgi:spore coat polysaccharide biosynthesis protein SpsF
MSDAGIVAIVCARSTSSRLPGKHFMLSNDRPMLWYLLERLKRVSSISKIVIATTTNEPDDRFVGFAEENNVEVFRGSEDNVMERVLRAAESFGAEVICEVTGDCPLIDPELVEQAIKTYRMNKVDYVNNGRGGLPDGMGAQIYSSDALRRSFAMTQDPLDLEHVTLHIRNNRQTFPAIYIGATPETDWPELGLTLDERDDFLLLDALIERFGDRILDASCAEIVRFLRSNPEMLKINSHVSRRGDT